MAVVQTPPYCVGLNLARTPRYEALALAQMLFDCVVGDGANAPPASGCDSAGAGVTLPATRHGGGGE